MLRTLFRAYRRRILFTYGLFNLENLLELARPLVLGLAVNDLLRFSYDGLLLFVALHLGHTLVGTLRRMYDTRAFTGIYTDLVTELVCEQRGRNVTVSQVAARSALSREFVDFYERDIPLMVQTLYTVAGALVMLGLYDRMLIVFCLAVLVPASVINYVYGRNAFHLNGRLNDELEREVEVIDGHQPQAVGEHYRQVARWRIRLSDAAAINFSVTEVFVLGLLAAALARFSTRPGVAAGDILAMFQYVWMFIGGLDNAAFLVEQLGRLRDIGLRMGPEPAGN